MRSVLTNTVLFTLFFVASAAKALEFGTKFVCCQSQQTSCLGGGGGTYIKETFHDRALTQADAWLRCPGATMYWNTWSCPASTPCADNVAPSTPPPAPPVVFNHLELRNNTGQKVYVAHQVSSEDMFRYGYVTAWFGMEANETRTFDYSSDRMCLAYTIDGRDRVQELVNEGYLKTTNFFWAHPTLATDFSWGGIINGLSFRLSLNKIPNADDHTMTRQAAMEYLKQQGMTSFSCMLFGRGKNYMPLN